ncbi:MAG: site-specific DNA-methyltransferase [Nitrospirae bacterium]|nr:site-specific DNA-methyltransferase [Nitrospirota bacterium]
MAKTYKGSLTLEWYYKQKAIMLREAADLKSDSDIPAPRVNWVNKDEALFYEVNENEGKGQVPYWVDSSDIRVKEARPLKLIKTYKAISKNKPGTLPGTNMTWEVSATTDDDPVINNMLIKGDNLLALNTLKKLFSNRPDDEKVKCIYIDPPYNTGQAFDNYDDNLMQSEWLTLMRDRLVILHDLLKVDGLLFIQLDEKNLFHVKVLLDDIFGKDNFVNIFTIKTSDPSGLKTVNPSPYDAAEYVLMYANNKAFYKYETINIPCAHDTGYSKYVTNINDVYSKWKIENISEHYAKRIGFTSAAEAKESKGKLDFLSEVAEYAILNADSVFQSTAIADDAGNDIVATRNLSKSKPDKIFKVDRTDKDVFVLNGRQMFFYSNKVKEIDGKITPTNKLTNIWMDIPYNGISKEGGVKFRESKKPEKLIRRVFETANIVEGDLVLDCFGGSGTTFAVAHKMKLTWIGVEIGNHADTHIIPRLTGILSGNDQSGITAVAKWTGGGGFKYYHLGQSILANDEFNWALGKSTIEESFLSSYDYIVDSAIEFEEKRLITDSDARPSVGVQKIGNKVRVAVVTLNPPKGKREMLPYDELINIYTKVKSKYNPEYINIFTNRGVEIASDSKPDDLDVIKIPHAIFAELEK